MDNKNEKIGGDLRVHIRTSEKFENFWYHYKWHTIIGVFLLIVGVILTLQLCTKTKYDVNILYAGEKIISSSSLAGDGSSEYSDIVSALEIIVGTDESGDNVNINLQNLRILSETELKEALEKIKDPMEKAALETSISDNYDLLYNYLMFADYYVAFLSEDIFLDFDKKLDGESVFAPIKPYTEDGKDYEYASERGIYLSSLEIYSDPAIKLLPEDTVVCIRLPGVLGARDDGKVYAASEDMLRAILSFKK